MLSDTPILPEDPAVLKAMIVALQAENAKMAATIKAHDLLIQTLQMRIAKLKKQAFGKSSEKIEREIEQLELALEDLLIAGAESATTPADDDAADADLELTTGDVDAGKPRRRPRVAATTPRERRELDPGSCCPDCGGDLRLVGEDMSEMLDLVAAQLKVLQIARLKKSCRRCEKMVQTPAPSRPIPGSMASAALLAWILVSKFDDHLPLYRLTSRLNDPRSGVDVTHDLASLIRTSVLLSAQGWRDHDDADALRHDPALRLAASSAAGVAPLEGPGLASQPTLSRFTAWMATPANLKVLREAVLEMAGRGIRAERQGQRLRSVTLDVDSAPIEVHGHQPKAEWNGHYNARIYHPLITSIAETGDMLDARLRAGNVGTADGALDVILDVTDRVRTCFSDVAMVRIDAGFPSATLLAGLEARGIDYVSRLRANATLDRMAEPLMKRPPGRRPAEPRMWLYELRYQADSWDKPRRVIRVVKEREGGLLLDRFFLVTLLDWTAKTQSEALAHYRERGKVEGHMGELKDVLAPALSSINRAKSHLWGKAPKYRTPAIDAFACSEVRLLIACLACQVMHVARRAMAKASGTGWSLRRLRERVLRAGARLVVSARRMTLALASAAAPYWAVLWPRLVALHWPDP